MKTKEITAQEMITTYGITIKGFLEGHETVMCYVQFNDASFSLNRANNHEKLSLCKLNSFLFAKILIYEDEKFMLLPDTILHSSGNNELMSQFNFRFLVKLAEFS